MKRKLIWTESNHNDGFDCMAPDGTGITVYPACYGQSITWSWIAYYDPELFESDHGTSATRGDVIEEAIKALKARGADLKALPRAY